ncbi:DUF5359 family protein [Aureibacillus halotolerans]|uniref:Uncharacterized protein n=1 Tax=Aureibacillus halotolerans TaxID=1508390 RepID=A0A4R6U505_9BACI|nr:DUF5359 family protein [Aureibacillus halotolerans]TDQ41548.1 hypothetical protein EV213_103126 [Aureibacillus halotolerans]
MKKTERILIIIVLWHFVFVCTAQGFIRFFPETLVHKISLYEGIFNMDESPPQRG